MEDFKAFEIETYVHMFDTENSLYISSYQGKEIKVDLITADLVDINEKCVEGKMLLSGCWVNDVFIADKILN